MAPSSPGGDTARHAGMQSLLAAAMGLTRVGSPISRSSSSSRPTKNMASMESNETENHPAAYATSALAAPSPPIFTKSPAGFGILQAPFAHSLKDASMAVDQSYITSGQMAAMNNAAIDAPPRGQTSHAQGSEAPLPTPASLSELPVGDPVEHLASTAAKSFPETLLEVLSSEEHSDVIAWLPHGRGFVVLDKERFASRVLPRHFDGAKYSSFARRMKRWGFDRVPRGPEMGAYYHAGFRRDRPELVKEMRYGAGGKFQEGKKEKKEKEDADKLKELVEKNVESQVQTSPSEKVPVQLNSESHVHVLQSHANPSPQDQGPSIPLASASRVQKRIAELERDFPLTQLMLSRKVANSLVPGLRATTASAANARARSAMANGSISNQRPYCALTYGVQRMIDAEHATRTLEAESIAGLCVRRSEAIMASEVLASSKIHANIMDAGSCAENKHMKQAATSRKNPACFEDRTDLLRPPSFPLRIPDSGTPIDLREQGIAKIQRDFLLTQSMLPRKVADCLAPGSAATAASAASVRTRSSTDGSISNQPPYRTQTYGVQRTADIEHAKRTLEVESIAGLCISQSPASTGRANAIEAVMASKVLASSKIHADIMNAGSCAENKHSKQAATACENTAWLENKADLLRPPSFPLRIPDSGAPIDPREQRIAKIQKELLLTQSVLPRKIADCLAPDSLADGGISNQRPHCVPTYNVKRMIDAERAKRTLEAESIAGLCFRRSHAPADRANAIDAIMASKILASSEIHANIMDAVARDLWSRSKPAPPAAVPSTELSPRRSVCSLSSVERSFTQSRPAATSRKERERFA